MFDISAENLARIRRQNQRKISVVIGNPPYNANQLNWNEHNQNREYPGVDARIKETYISTAQRKRPSSTICTRASSVGPATGWARMA